MKRIFSLVCAFALALSLIPGTVRAADSSLKSDIQNAVSAQIRSFASSLGQSDAVNTAARALAKHGLTQNGKRLTQVRPTPSPLRWRIPSCFRPT